MMTPERDEADETGEWPEADPLGVAFSQVFAACLRRSRSTAQSARRRCMTKVGVIVLDDVLSR
jgi:hypothetical protein